MRHAAGTLSVSFALCLVACGGGSGGAGTSPAPPTTGTNVATLLVDAGPAGTVNAAFATLTICTPGTTNCTTVDHMLVDTGSTGVRVLAAQLGTGTTLPVSQAASGTPLYECQQFADGYTWGSVRTADIQIGGELARSLPIQLIGESTAPPVPAACPNGSPAENSVQSLGANGILGIGVFREDCGNACAGTAIPAAYYACTGATCMATTAVLAAQLQNPVFRFAINNNGVLLQLPAVGAAGQLGTRGSLIFGIDTQSNNALGTATVLHLDALGSFRTIYKGQTISLSFIDSGSNGYFFADSSLMACTGTTARGFYCPATVQVLGATNQSIAGVTSSVNFSVANAEALIGNNPAYTAFSNLGGTNPLTSSFDWGLPFFYGRSVYFAIEGQSTASGTGPYVAY
jgi:Protein of unknown function (DUF3443)